MDESTQSLAEARLAGLVPLVVRVIAGVIMATHGLQKLTQMGPGNFGN